jgi:hypothetical protein
LTFKPDEETRDNAPVDKVEGKGNGEEEENEDKIEWEGGEVEGGWEDVWALEWGSWRLWRKQQQQQQQQQQHRRDITARSDRKAKTDTADIGMEVQVEPNTKADAGVHAEADALAPMSSSLSAPVFASCIQPPTLVAEQRCAYPI